LTIITIIDDTMNRFLNISILNVPISELHISLDKFCIKVRFILTAKSGIIWLISGHNLRLHIVFLFFNWIVKHPTPADLQESLKLLQAVPPCDACPIGHALHLSAPKKCIKMDYKRRREDVVVHV